MTTRSHFCIFLRARACNREASSRSGQITDLQRAHGALLGTRAWRPVQRQTAHGFLGSMSPLVRDATRALTRCTSRANTSRGTMRMAGVRTFSLGVSALKDSAIK